MTTPPIVALSAERDPRAEAVVTAGLAAFNKAAFGRVDAQTLDVVVCADNSGEIVGGLLGHSSLGLFFLDLFYLPKKLRGGGVGSRALRMAEEEAIRRGCRAATLVTVNFQAPEFYARHGWEEFGRIASAPGVERIFMRKTFAV